MNPRAALAWSLGLTLGVLALGVALLPILPDLLPTHWNTSGRPDAFTPKVWAILMLPAFMALMTVLIPILPAISPAQFRIENFSRPYGFIMTCAVAMLGAIQLGTFYSVLRPGTDSGRVITALVLVFFVVLGNQMARVKRNFWVGIRTPWTLADDEVWRMTHRLAAWWMVGTSLLGLPIVLLGGPMGLVFFLILAGALVPSAWSYVLYRQRHPNTARA